jgi:hypothetical protein
VPAAIEGLRRRAGRGHGAFDDRALERARDDFDPVVAGVRTVARTLKGSIIESAVPAPGTPTQPLDRGWHQNTWFRLRDENYDRLREKLEFIARTVRVRLA